MKLLKIVLGTFLVFTVFAFTATENKAPQKVKDAFSKKFPTVKKVKWEKENVTKWEAEFKMDKVKYSANFLEDGTWKETEHEIDEKEIPEKVKSAIMTNFLDYIMEEAEISETQNGIVYEFEMEKGEIEIEVAIDVNGKILSQELKKENDKD
ncbi:Putative beta-lactamase-inhibitor-like, PepSY-like [Flaviramulus basaltis]|uniref:Putative beta-lactamase-inhibitor-like, PepSY-like n=1 Tax=Flaviramulus basaltis TaxID=369401 RepID=A0A1K2IR74_9FLAO|nr:PepSY-like domain-containing protein [Flaviramulus basaltis]SFZ94219.1 Putative beta-lactamase-inhibitor-like, PepSY-like [Flaviramulus basaltis]